MYSLIYEQEWIIIKHCLDHSVTKLVLFNRFSTFPFLQKCCLPIHKCIRIRRTKKYFSTFFSNLFLFSWQVKRGLALFLCAMRFSAFAIGLQILSSFYYWRQHCKWNKNWTLRFKSYSLAVYHSKNCYTVAVMTRVSDGWMGLSILSLFDVDRIHFSFWEWGLHFSQRIYRKICHSWNSHATICRPICKRSIISLSNFWGEVVSEKTPFNSTFQGTITRISALLCDTLIWQCLHRREKQ